MEPGSFVVPWCEQVNDGEARNNDQEEFDGQHEEDTALEEERRNIEEQKEEDKEEEDLYMSNKYINNSIKSSKKYHFNKIEKKWVKLFNNKWIFIMT